MNWLQPVTLVGEHAELHPLSQTHGPDLAEAVSDGRLWELWYTTCPHPDEMESEIARRIDLFDSGSMLPFAVMTPEGKAVGMTTLMHADARYKRVEIGSTWYAASYQRTAVNTQCKLLLLSHAFTKLDCIAVELRTSSVNRGSRAAIERLGAKLDGVLRHHQRHRNGTLRDTCVYSIIEAEWPTVQANLESALGRRASK